MKRLPRCHPEVKPKDLDRDRDVSPETKPMSSSKARSFAALRMTNGGRQSHPGTRRRVWATHASPLPPIDPKSAIDGG